MLSKAKHPIMNEETLTCTPWHCPPGQVCMQVQVSLLSHRPGTCPSIFFRDILREDDIPIMVQPSSFLYCINCVVRGILPELWTLLKTPP